MDTNRTTTVYHYTSPQGAHSILSEKKIWFTDVQYMNDKSEIVTPESGYDVYVFSTSINWDSAAMWNYYVKNGAFQGYNLGIHKDAFIERLDGDVSGQGCCKKSERCKRMCRIKLVHKKVDYSDSIENGNVFTKLDAFKSEEEYRFVLSVPKCFEFFPKSNWKRKFRVGVSGIITPYIEWRFEYEGKMEIFSQITLAPMIEPDLAVKSFKRFLAEEVRENINIVPSRIKIRF